MSKKIIAELKSYKSLVNEKYASEVDDAIDLYVKKQIPNVRTVEGILNGLMSRGAGPSKAIAKLEKYRNTESITGRLTGSNENAIKNYLINYTIPFILDGNQRRERTKTFHERCSKKELKEKLQIFAEDEVKNNNDYRSNIVYGNVHMNSIQTYTPKPLSHIKLGQKNIATNASIMQIK